MKIVKKIYTPLSDETISALRVGEKVRITGVVYTARDAAHKRVIEMIGRGETPPFEFSGQIVYYAGPSPARPGQAIGAIGPTTSGRMDAYSPALIKLGLKAMIGKGLRNGEVKRAITEHRGVYFAAIGGAAALISRSVRKAELVAFPDLGAEAIRRLEVGDFPAIVAIDSFGADIYERGNE
ncbi:MAG: Fe-S-containing hydro-lyase [Synergistaceae bacterium]|nr:Fe-S-containing hydro-lyase [Synergistaceae bacterium]